MLVEREQQFDRWKHAFPVTWPYARLKCPPFSQPGAFVLHLYLGDHDVGILVPAAPSNLYHAVSIANRFTLCSGGPRVQGIGSQLSPCRSSLYCQTVKLCSTTGTVAKPHIGFLIPARKLRHCHFWILNWATEWSQNLNFLPTAKRLWV